MTSSRSPSPSGRKEDSGSTGLPEAPDPATAVHLPAASGYHRSPAPTASPTIPAEQLSAPSHARRLHDVPYSQRSEGGPQHRQQPAPGTFRDSINHAGSTSCVGAFEPSDSESKGSDAGDAETDTIAELNAAHSLASLSNERSGVIRNVVWAPTSSTGPDRARPAADANRSRPPAGDRPESAGGIIAPNATMPAAALDGLLVAAAAVVAPAASGGASGRRTSASAERSGDVATPQHYEAAAATSIELGEDPGRRVADSPLADQAAALVLEAVPSRSDSGMLQTAEAPAVPSSEGNDGDAGGAVGRQLTADQAGATQQTGALQVCAASVDTSGDVAEQLTTSDVGAAGVPLDGALAGIAASSAASAGHLSLVSVQPAVLDSGSMRGSAAADGEQSPDAAGLMAAHGPSATARAILQPHVQAACSEGHLTQHSDDAAPPLKTAACCAENTDLGAVTAPQLGAAACEELDVEHHAQAADSAESTPATASHSVAAATESTAERAGARHGTATTAAGVQHMGTAQSRPAGPELSAPGPASVNLAAALGSSGLGSAGAAGQGVVRPKRCLSACTAPSEVAFQERYAHLGARTQTARPVEGDVVSAAADPFGTRWVKHSTFAPSQLARLRQPPNWERCAPCDHCRVQLHTAAT